VLEAEGERALEFVEADPRARRLFVAAVLVALAVAGALAFFALHPPAPQGETSLELKALAQRALWSALLATAFAFTVSVVSLRLAAHSVRTRQWPPLGMRMPFRTRVQALPRPGRAWGLAGAIVVAVFGVALLYWLHYFQAREFAALFAP
jgi:hypothetical protein